MRSAAMRLSPVSMTKREMPQARRSASAFGASALSESPSVKIAAGEPSSDMYTLSTGWPW